MVLFFYFFETTPVKCCTSQKWESVKSILFSKRNTDGIRAGNFSYPSCGERKRGTFHFSGKSPGTATAFWKEAVTFSLIKQNRSNGSKTCPLFHILGPTTRRRDVHDQHGGTGKGAQAAAGTAGRRAEKAAGRGTGADPGASPADRLPSIRI